MNIILQRTGGKWLAVAYGLALTIAGGASTAASQSATQQFHSGVVLETNAHTFRLVTVVEGLENPWGLAFLPDGGMLVTERAGRLRLVRDGVLQPEPIAGVPEVRYRNHGGLLDVALHPNYQQNNLVYLTYSKPGERGATTAVLRARFDGRQLLDAKDIFVAEAWTSSDVNFGSRIIFDGDGFMYVSIGERNFPFPENQGMSAQDLTNHMGTIVRLRDDGSVPQDNPFVGRTDALPEIYSYGHRNPQGLTIHPETGEVWSSEHGPLGGDEVNIIRSGGNYGWPRVSFGMTYRNEVISENPVLEGTELPRFYWVPSIGISGMTFYTGDQFPRWKGELFVTGQGQMQVQRVRMQGQGTNEREWIISPQQRLRFRDIRQGPDGFLYLLTSDRPRQEGSGLLLRMEPVE